MARNSNLKSAAVITGAAMGGADRKAHKVAKAGAGAKDEVVAISKYVKALKRQLQENTEGLKCALR